VYCVFLGDWSSVANQTRATRLAQFLNDLMSSDYMNLLAQYGVGTSRSVVNSVFTQARETGTNFLIYPQSNFATILPKHCKSDEDVLQVRQILRQAFQEKFRQG
jgi:hypothetical protein